ncbi:hypothetical protein ACNKHU_00480 [Shigella flexneri]
MGLGAIRQRVVRHWACWECAGTYEANMTMHNADVTFAVGVRFDDRTTNDLAKCLPKCHCSAVSILILLPFLKP